jgi:hypothetical protein
MLHVTITYGHDRQHTYFTNLNKKHCYYGSHISLSCTLFINFIFQGKLLDHVACYNWHNFMISHDFSWTCHKRAEPWLHELFLVNCQAKPAWYLDFFCCKAWIVSVSILKMSIEYYESLVYKQPNENGGWGFCVL